MLLITFNANGIAGSVMISTMDTVEMSASKNCHGAMKSAVDKTVYCEHENCDEINCGVCVYHSSNAVVEYSDNKLGRVTPINESQYFITELSILQTKMFRPPRSV